MTSLEELLAVKENKGDEHLKEKEKENEQNEEGKEADGVEPWYKKTGGAWHKLRWLKCTRNAITRLDESLHELVHVTRIELQHNAIFKIENLQYCIELEYLNLGFNKISSTFQINHVIGSLKFLILRDNILKSTLGLERILSLEKLDLCDNLIEDFEEIERLNCLPLLEGLWTKGNPIDAKPNYRLRTIASFGPNLETLNGSPITDEEQRYRYLMQQQRRKSSRTTEDGSATPSKNTSSSQSNSPILRAQTMSSLAIPVFGGGSVSAASSPYGSFRDNTSSFSTHSPSLRSQQKKKKKKKKRVAVIENLPSPQNFEIKKYTNSTPLIEPIIEEAEQPTNTTPEQNDTSVSSLSQVEQNKDKEKKTTEGEANKTTSEQNGKHLDVYNDDDDVEAFQSKVQALHKEGGTRWLLVLNELQKAESPETKRQRERQEKAMQEEQERERRKRMYEKMQLLQRQASQRINEKILNEISEDKDEKKAAASSMEKQEEKKDASASSPPTPLTTPGEKKSLPVVDKGKEKDKRESKSNVNIDMDAVDDITEDFAVETEKGEPRILLVGNVNITEADVTTGRNIISRPSKYLFNVTDVTPGGQGFAVVRLDFWPPRRWATMENRTAVVDSSTYTLETFEQKSHLVALLQKHIERNSKAQTQVQCMNCSKVFTVEAGVKQVVSCPNCNGSFLVYYESPDAQSKVGTNNGDNTSSPAITDSESAEISSRENATSDASSGYHTSTEQSTSQDSNSSNTVAANREEYDADSMDVNLQLHLRLNFFKGGSAEQLVYFFASNFLMYDAKNDEETVAYLLLTTLSLYILTRKRKPTAQDPGYTLLAEFKLAQLQRLVIGLFYQYFRLEVEESKAFVFITREHDRTHRFLNLLFSTVQRCEDIFDPIEPVIYNKEIRTNIANDLLLGKSTPIHAYALLFHKVYPTRSSLILPFGRKDTANWMRRTLIITNEHLILSNEDLTRWPKLHYPGAKTPTSPQFRPINMIIISDIVALELDTTEETYFKVVYERDVIDTKENLSIELMTQGMKERKQIVKIISQLWYALFKLPLTINTFSSKG
ncbi:LKB1 serine/threonine kinase interacting protein 1 [Balamuthia mandrillaris]